MTNRGVPMTDRAPNREQPESDAIRAYRAAVSMIQPRQGTELAGYFAEILRALQQQPLTAGEPMKESDPNLKQPLPVPPEQEQQGIPEVSGWVQVCTCGQRCPIHDPPPPVTTYISPPCSGCGSSEVGAHYPHCRYATTGSKVL